MSELGEFNLNLEKEVIAGLMRSGRKQSKMARQMVPKVFHDEVHKNMVRMIRQALAEGVAPDATVIGMRMVKAGVAGNSLSYVLEVAEAGFFSTSANLDIKCVELYELYQRRELVRFAERLRDAAKMPTNSPFDLLDKSVAFFRGLRPESTSNRVPMQELMHNSIGRAEEANKSDTPPGFTFPFAAMSEYIVMPGDMCIIAGRPGMGKTAVINALMKHWSRCGIHCLMIQLDMDNDQYAAREVASGIGITGFKMVSGKGIQEQDWGRMLDYASKEFKHVDVCTVFNGSEFEAEIDGFYADHNIQPDDLVAVAIDYIQLVDGNGNNREQEVASISKLIKRIAKNKDRRIAMFPLAQLKRPLNNSDVPIPKLSDLRESGQLEQDADMVIFAHRPEYYGEKTFASGQSAIGAMELMPLKTRMGNPGGEIVVGMHYGLVYDLERRPENRKWEPVPDPTVTVAERERELNDTERAEIEAFPL